MTEEDGRDPLSSLLNELKQSYNQPSESESEMVLVLAPLILQLPLLSLLLSDESVTLASALSLNNLNNTEQIQGQYAPLLLPPPSLLLE